MKDSLTDRVPFRIINYLETKEGCLVQHIETTNFGIQVMVKDAFGFCFDITIRNTGREQLQPETDTERNQVFQWREKYEKV